MVRLIFLVFLSQILVACASNNELGGALVGAIAGAYLGDEVTDEDADRKKKYRNRAIGAFLGGAAGYGFGKYLDKRDRANIHNTVRSGRGRSWVNQDTNIHYTTKRASSGPLRVNRNGRVASCKPVVVLARLPDNTHQNMTVDGCSDDNGKLVSNGQQI